MGWGQGPCVVSLQGMAQVNDQDGSNCYTGLGSSD